VDDKDLRAPAFELNAMMEEAHAHGMATGGQRAGASAGSA
jgi:hypothetical protein